MKKKLLTKVVMSHAGPKIKGQLFLIKFNFIRRVLWLFKEGISLVCICLYLCGRDIWICSFLGLQAQEIEKKTRLYLFYLIFNSKNLLYNRITSQDLDTFE